MTNVSVRTATAADLEVLQGFEQAIIAAERAYDPTLRRAGARYYDIAALIAAEHARVLVAEADGAPIGCGLARVEAAKPWLRHREHGYLGMMYVRPEYRGRGVNRRVVAALEAWCRSRQVLELRLDVYSANQPALRAYEKAGFCRHLVEMRKALDP